MPGISVSRIPIPFNKGGFSYSSYWATLTNMHIKSRSGNEMVDDYGNNATILPAYYNKPLDTQYAYVADGGDFDIGTSDFTLGGWVKSETSETGTYRYLMGKYGSPNGGFGIGVWNDAGSSLYAIAKNNTGAVILALSEQTFNGQGWLFVLMEIDQTNDKLRLFCNNVQIAEADITGTFPSVSTYNFALGCTMAGATPNEPILVAKSSHADTYLFHRLLSPTEKTTIYNRGIITDPYAYWPCMGSGNYLFDASGNDNHLINIDGKTAFGAAGSFYGLDNGYVLYEDSYGKAYCPLKADLSEITVPAVPYLTRVRKFDGSLTKHNLCNSMLLFAGDEWDRSDVTRYSSLARNLKYYYDAANPKAWSVEILNNLLFQSWANINYKGFNFVKITNHSYKERYSLDEILTCTDNQEGADYAKAISWANDYVFDNIYENDYLYWELSTTNVFAVNGSKLLRFDSAKVYLSLDSGATWGTPVTIAGATEVIMGHIFDNGDILFAVGVAGVAVMYRSTDNLANITEITPLDINGDPYSPTTLEYAQAIPPVNAAIGDANVLVWAVYNYGEACPVFYSVDNGATVKQCYLIGTTILGLAANHFHGIVYNPNNSKFWAYTGDGTDECNIIEGTYNDVTDAWSWAKIYGDNDGGSDANSNLSYYKLGGIAFNGDDIYWSSDSDDRNKRTVFKCAYSDFGTPANYVKVLDNRKFAWRCDIVDGDLVSSNLYREEDGIQILLGKELVSYYNIPLFSKTLSSEQRSIAFVGKDDNGWLIFSIQENSGELYVQHALKGDVLRIKIK